jgi:hypothetical protein
MPPAPSDSSTRNRPARTRGGAGSSTP